jgi:hypothetical protein
VELRRLEPTAASSWNYARHDYTVDVGFASSRPRSPLKRPRSNISKPEQHNILAPRVPSRPANNSDESTPPEKATPSRLTDPDCRYSRDSSLHNKLRTRTQI